MTFLVWLILTLAAAIAVAYAGAGGLVWTGVLAASLAAAWVFSALPTLVVAVLAVALVAAGVALNVPRLRRWLASDALLAWFRRTLPQMSSTEREALEAGTTWWDAELFSGRPDWSKLLALRAPALTPEEQSFIDIEVEQLCAMSSEWETTYRTFDLPPHVWQFIKDKGFLGLIIPKKYGGREFSAWAHSQAVTKLSTRSSAAAISVMVPNSLGPAELLLHYGTEEQKNHYLPRLARGQEIPCFALTSPEAGSDAASIPDTGVVGKGLWQGREVVGLRVSWDKRYITLAPIATLLGLAFRVVDPERLLGGEVDRGITLALIPTSHPGVVVGRRHMPLNSVFHNGPTSGTDVFIPLDWVIGGREQIGNGWRMLMECLAAGRSISLPSCFTGMSKLAVRAVGGYARVRKQFKVPVGRFEGVEEALARMGGNLYLMDAARALTTLAVDLGEKPAILSAIAKYHITERGRKVVIDGMDVVGGKGICLGPSNFLGRPYQQLPIGITVEGANILTRSLIIFGQGAIRCHPWVLKEMQATRERDPERASVAFDEAFWGHVKFVVTNGARALVMGLTGSHFVKVPENVAPETRRYYQQLTRFSAAFAFLADISMLMLGGALKRKEKLSARLGDILSLMYLCSATLKRFEVEGRQKADAPLMHWAIWDAMFAAQNAFEGVISNFPSRAAAEVLWRVVFPLGRPYEVPSDRLGHQVARLLLEPSATRDRLTAGMFLPRDPEDPVTQIERAVEAVIEADGVEAKVRSAVKEGYVTAQGLEAQVAAAHAGGLISAEEKAKIERARELTAAVIRVDDFPIDFGPDELPGRRQAPLARVA